MTASQGTWERFRAWNGFLTQQVQSGLCFVLSDRGQPTPVARERGHLSVQEGVLGADSLDNRKRTWLADEELPFRQLGDLLRTVLTVQQSRFQVGFGDVVSVVSVNLRDTTRPGYLTIK